MAAGMAIEGRSEEQVIRYQRSGAKKRLTTEVAEDPQRERRIAGRDFSNEGIEGRRKAKADPSTTRPDAPQNGAEEKVEPLRSG